MVCGALWWSPGQTRPLRGQIVQFTFPLWRSGTAVFLASGSRCVTPRPFIGRDPAATHCAHTRLYYLYQKMWAARVSFIHCSAFGRVLAGGFSRVYSAAECLGVSHSCGLRLAECWRSPLWGAQTAVRYTHLSARLCALDRRYKRIAFERSTAMGSALAGSQNDVHTEGPKLRIILSHASRSMTSYSTWSREYLRYLERGERQRTARICHFGRASERQAGPRGGAPAARHGGTPAARGSGRSCNRAWRARADRGQLGQCARWQVCLR